MNREQRRAGMQPTMQRRPQQTESPVTTNFGHNGERVIMEFDRPVKVMMMTVEQAEITVKMLRDTIDVFRAHLAKGHAS